MLAASAVVGLIAPMGAQATDINFEDMNSYRRSSSKKQQKFDSKTFENVLATLDSSVDSFEGKVNEFEAGSFSDTTILDSKVVFDLGAISYSDSDTGEEAKFGYSYTANLNTSFTGDDNLYIRLKTGNHADWMQSKTYGGYLGSVGKGTGAISVDKIWYQFPVGDNNTIWVGPKIENYYMHGTAPSIYAPVTKQFALGGNGNAYGASTDTGAGWAYKADNGFAISSNIGTKSSTTQKDANDDYINSGLLTDETKTSWATQLGYTKDQYSVSAIYNLKYNSWADGYYNTVEGTLNKGVDGNFSAVGLRGWWRPEQTGTATPSISLGFDSSQFDGAASNESTATAWFTGLTWQDMFQADDKIGLAFGMPTKNESESVDPFAYELYYSFKTNDSTTITPTIFGGTDRNGDVDGDVFGALVQTTFKF